MAYRATWALGMISGVLLGGECFVSIVDIRGVDLCAFFVVLECIYSWQTRAEQETRVLLLSTAIGYVLMIVCVMFVVVRRAAALSVHTNMCRYEVGVCVCVQVQSCCSTCFNNPVLIVILYYLNIIYNLGSSTT